MLYRGCVMVTSSFVNRVVWCLIVLVGAAPLLLVIEVGGFGTTAQSYFRSLWHPLYAVYQAHKSSFDLLILVIGTTVPAVSGGLAILKGFYYAEMNLPKRLQELVDRVREQHLHERPKLLSYVSGPFDTRDFLVPTILSNPLAQMLRLFGWVSLRNQVRDFASAVDQFQDEIKVLATKKEDVENKKVTAHLLRGAYFAAKAKEFDQISLDYRGHIEKSLAEYEAVVAMRGADLDALEGAAVQAGAIGDVTKQRSYLDSAISVADLQKQLLRHARALRKSAVIIERGGTPNDWNWREDVCSRAGNSWIASGPITPRRRWNLPRYCCCTVTCRPPARSSTRHEDHLSAPGLCSLLWRGMLARWENAARQGGTSTVE